MSVQLLKCVSYDGVQLMVNTEGYFCLPAHFFFLLKAKKAFYFTVSHTQKAKKPLQDLLAFVWKK